MKSKAALAKTTEEKYIINSVDRALEILDLFWKEQPQVSITEVSRKLDINSNMAYRLLMTLQHAGYIQQDPATSMFQLTLKVLKLSRIALNTIEIRKQAMPYLKALSLEFQKVANINLGVLDERDVLIIERFDSEKLPRTNSQIGKRLPLHATALGKVLIADCSEEQLKTLFPDEKLKQYTPQTTATRTELLQELAQARSEKMAWDIEEHMPSVLCIAAPIRDGAHNIVAAVSISAFDLYMSKDDLKKAALDLQETVTKISHTMGLSY